ncbi:MAG: PQQ-binding-like beta-propeller repeat protein [Phycisphaerae bacterium]|nr:PQQ-binding-like beta-propeller repeat protein [Phycisphaerae bacterium]
MSTSTLHAEDWPNWRGPRYDGSSAETKFARSWTGERPQRWERNLGSAYSGLTVVGDRLFTCGVAMETSERGKPEPMQVLYCLRTADGEVAWKSVIEDIFRNEWGDGARGTPTYDDGRVYIMGANGTVACFDANDGKKLWARKYDERPMWGYSGSVLIRGTLAIVATGGKKGALRALDKSSGREVWRCGDDASAGYSTPYPFTFEKKEYVISFLGTSAIAAEVTSGREVLRIPWKTDWNVNAATPIYHDGHLWLGSGYRTGCAVYALKPAGDKLEAKEVWKSKVMLNKFQTPVLFGGKLYAFDERAFKCVDFMTGELDWKERGQNGTVVLADGNLITLTESGKLRIGPASPTKFEPTGEAQILDDRCWTVPTLVDGRLYARNLERVVCIDLSESQPVDSGSPKSH